MRGLLYRSDRGKHPRMLSTLVLAPSFASSTSATLAPVVRTLAALVPLTVEGLVRDVTVVTSGPDAGLQRVADHAGCGLVAAPAFEAALRQGLAAARSSKVFVLRAGATLDRGFLDEGARLLGPEANPDDTGVLLLRQTPEGLATRLLPDLAPVAGIIASREKLGGPAKDFVALIRHLGRCRTLASRALMVP